MSNEKEDLIRQLGMEDEGEDKLPLNYQDPYGYSSDQMEHTPNSYIGKMITGGVVFQDGEYE